MVNCGIIEPVREPSEWVSNIVVVEKPNKSLRICMDPKYLNEFLIRQVHPIPTVDELKAKMANKTCFSVVDLKDGFFHMELDENSRNLCTFSSPEGNFRFLRCPFGVKIAPEVFQSLMQKYFGDINGVIVYFDDILICGVNRRDHDKVMQKVLDRARNLNIKFNPEKLQYRLAEVRYLGFIFCEKGMKPDNDRVQSIIELKQPTNKKELQQVLGMINYVRQFIPNLAEISFPLRDLLKKDAHWYWSPKHSETYNKIKQLIKESTYLSNFDPNIPLEIQCDASREAIGCCLMQNGKPLSYSSRSLTDTESRYAQIELEFLAVLFACKKYHDFIYGRAVKVYTDHLPLVTVMKKDLDKIVNNRLRNMKFRLLNYNINLCYKPGKFLYIADLLSRNIIRRPERDEDNDLKDYVHLISLNEPVEFSEEKLELFQKETLSDTTLKNVVEFYNNGWPKNSEKLQNELKFYFKIRGDITYENGLLYYSNLVIIPKSLRKVMVNILHETHLGISKTIEKAKQFIFWPGMRLEIENIIENCYVCNKFSRSKTKEKLINHEIPEVPFYKIALDIAEFDGKNFLILVDYYSRWLEIKNLKSKDSKSIISELKTIFGQFGIPQTVVADNVPFSSSYFEEFSKSYNFHIVTSSPYYPKANGLAETYVGIAKNMLRKYKFVNSDIDLYLLNYRNSIVAGLTFTPAQLLQNRILRDKFPVQGKVHKHNPVPNDIMDKMKYIQAKQKSYYDITARNEEEFYPGQKVMVQDKFTKQWERAKVVKKINFPPRSYIVEDCQGRKMRRNSIFIKRGVSDDADLCNANPTPILVESQQYRRSGRQTRMPGKFKDYVF